MANNIRCIAYYLPQFHPIPENDEWWGKGFTEWTNVTKAKPMFAGHIQPKLPADLGFYDLRLRETREAQANLAKTYGIEGFCYWHYWMGNGKRILERPFNEVLESGQPDFPFCVAWANHDWTGHWFGNFAKTLLKQEYGGKKEYAEHFSCLHKAFSDSRYITVDDKPLFYIYRAFALPNPTEFTDYFRELAHQHGYKGLYMITESASPEQVKSFGLDGAVFPRHREIGMQKPKGIRKVYKRFSKNHLQVYEYKKAMKFFLKDHYNNDEFPCIIPNWDSTPRLGKKGLVLNNVSPSLFKEHLLEVKKKLESHSAQHRIAFIKSWNEWAEGNYMEPDIREGHIYLQTLQETIINQ